MLLAIDIGNTNIVLGVFGNDKILEKWRISTDERKTEDEYGTIILSLLKNNTITQAIISSVVPNLNIVFRKLINKYFLFEPLVVTYKLKMNIKLKYANPSEIGADRIVNAVAVAKLHPLPAIIIDFGTAITVCYVDKKKNYHGGLILPGISLMLRALHLGTAKLPEVEVKKPSDLIGANTVEGIQSGIFHQTIGALNYIINRMRKKYSTDSKVIVTGGLAHLFKNEIQYKTIVDMDLTLKGLNILNKLNR